MLPEPLLSVISLVWISRLKQPHDPLLPATSESPNTEHSDPHSHRQSHLGWRLLFGSKAITSHLPNLSPEMSFMRGLPLTAGRFFGIIVLAAFMFVSCVFVSGFQRINAANRVQFTIMNAEQARKISDEHKANHDLVYERIEEFAKEGKTRAFIRAVDLNGVEPEDAKRELESFHFKVEQGRAGVILIVSW